MKIFRIFVASLLAILGGFAHAGALQDRKEALEAHITSYGRHLKALNDAEFVQRSDLAVTLLETPLSAVDDAYTKKVYTPWRNTLQGAAVQGRLKGIASANAVLRNRVRSILSRTDTLAEKPRYEGSKPVANGPSVVVGPQVSGASGGGTTGGGAKGKTKAGTGFGVGAAAVKR